MDIPRRKKSEEKEAAEKALSLRSDSLAVFFLGGGFFVAFSLYSYWSKKYGFVEDGSKDLNSNVMGIFGAYVSQALDSLLGWCALVTILWAFLVARRIWAGTSPLAAENTVLSRIGAMIASFMMLVSAATFVTVLVGHKGGGKVGAFFAYTLIPFVNEGGTLLISFFAFILSLGIATGVGAAKILELFRFIGQVCRELLADACFLSGKVLQFFSKSLYNATRQVLSQITMFLKVVLALLTSPVGSIRKLIQGTPIVKGVRPAQRRKKTTETEEPYVLGKKEDEDPEEEREEEIGEEESEEAAEVKVSRGAAFPLLTRRLERSKQQKIIKRKEEKKKAKDTERNFHLPPLDVLVAGEKLVVKGPNDSELIKNSKRLEKTLKDFRIGGRISEVQPGPVITLYHFEPAAGVKVQKIVTLADDIALALKVASVRIYAPVPGKGTVGIEVPNAHREIVRLRDVLAAPQMTQADSVLELAIGKDTFGDPYVADLAKMPHLLIAGATGTGKSVCINAMLLSLLYRNTPETLRLIMIDPKMLELSIYEDIPHLLAPVVTNPKRARGVLFWAVEEMERRYQAMKDLGVRNLASYNRAVLSGDAQKSASRMRKQVGGEDVIELTEEDVVAVGLSDAILSRSTDESLGNPTTELSGFEKPLPRIVIIVDELADLMLTVGREIEELLTRLAQKARASGIHLILATQRPSVNVITGLIKANFPARISFQVASRIDARTVMDTSGAEKLLGQGDMLFLLPGSGRVRRLHSAFVSDKEVQDVTEWIKSQGPPDYDPDIEAMIKRIEEMEKNVEMMPGMEDELDPLYDQAVRLVLEKGLASTSMVQRAFRIGYNRAARILEMMEREGVVGPQDGAKPREVLVPSH